MYRDDKVNELENQVIAYINHAQHPHQIRQNDLSWIS